MIDRNVTHATFTLKRTYNAPAEKVFHAFADFETKKKWFGGGTIGPKDTMDFRVGGKEHSEGTAEIHGKLHTFRFDAIFLDIVENARIIYAYDMADSGTPISVSLTTIEFHSKDGKTHLTFTEQGAFLDGHDDPKMREAGTAGMLESLVKVVEA